MSVLSTRSTLILLALNLSILLSPDLSAQINQDHFQASRAILDANQETTPEVPLYYSHSRTVDVSYTPAMLSSGATTYVDLYSEPTPSYCTERCVKRARLKVSFHVGGDQKEFRHGRQEFTSEVTFKIDAMVNAVVTTPNVQPVTLKLKSNADSIVPEQVYLYDFTQDHPDQCDAVNPVFDQLRLVVTSFTAATLASVATSARLTVELIEDFAIDAKKIGAADCSSGNLLIEHKDVVGDNPLTFRWQNRAGCMNDSFPNYEVQVLRLFNIDEANRYTPAEIRARIDWRKALSLETYGPKQEMTLTMAEGTGFYVWRVRPIGDRFANGIGNDANWGCWAEAPPQDTLMTIALNGSVITPALYDHCIFYYDQFDDTLNWQYGRIFVEGKDSRPGISESMTYANGLLRPRQQQTHLMSNDSTLVSATVYDYVGRGSLGSLPAPAREGKVQFLPELLQNGAALYRDEHFDDDSDYRDPDLVNAGPVTEYYSNQNPDLTIPSADSLPFSRTLYYPDPTGKVQEVMAPGATHTLGTGRGARTTRVYYASVNDKELVSIFGDEAPIDTTVTKIISVDQNDVGSVQYIAKSGKVIATCLMKLDENPLLDDFDARDTLNSLVLRDTVRAIRPNGEYGFSGAKNFTLIDTAEVTFNASISAKVMQVICEEYCAVCDYEVVRRVRRLRPNAAVVYASTATIAPTPESCETISVVGTPETIELLPGDYVIESFVNANRPDTVLIDGVEIIRTTLDKHVDSLRRRFAALAADSLDAIFGADHLQYYLHPDSTKDEALYDSLLVNYEKYYNALSSSHTVEIASCCTITLPPSPCESGCNPLRNFEEYLYDSWEGKLPENVVPLNWQRKHKGYFWRIDFGRTFPQTAPFTADTGAFNALIRDMIDNGGYACEDLWKCWSALVQQLDKLAFETSSSGTITARRQDFDLLETFLTCAGKKICGFSTTAYGAGGYLEQAWKYYEDLDVNDDCKTNLGYLPLDLNDTTWHCGVGYSDSAAHINHERLRLCMWQTHYKTTIDNLVATAKTDALAANETYAELTQKTPCTSAQCIRDMVDGWVDSCQSRCELRRRDFRDSLIQTYLRDGYHVEGYLHLDPTPPLQNDTLSTRAMACITSILMEQCRADCELTVEFNGAEDTVLTMGTPAEIERHRLARYAPTFELAVPTTSGTCPGPDYVFVSKPMSLGDLAVETLNEHLRRFRDTMDTDVALWDYKTILEDLALDYPALDPCLGDPLILSDTARLAVVYKDSTMSTEFVLRRLNDNCYISYRVPQLLQEPLYSPANPHPMVAMLNKYLDDNWAQTIDKSVMDQRGTPWWVYVANTEHLDLLNYYESYTLDSYYLQNWADMPLKPDFACDTDGINLTAADPWELCNIGLPCFNGTNASLQDVLTVHSAPTGALRLSTSDTQLHLTGRIDITLCPQRHVVANFWSTTSGNLHDTLALDNMRFELAADGDDVTTSLWYVEDSNPTVSKNEIHKYLDMTFTQDIGRFIQTAEGYLAFETFFVTGNQVVVFDCINLDCGTPPPADTCNIVPICNVCDTASCGSICFRWIEEVDIPAQAVFRPKSCARQAIEFLLPNLEQQLYGECMETRLAEMRQTYINTCVNPDSLADMFIAERNEDFYHYTLFYHDRSGNLVRTVPPAGVRPLRDPDILRSNHPAHEMATEYKYNSLGQLIRQETPDGGAQRYIYDDIGRLRFSQNEVQGYGTAFEDTEFFSYTKYDALGRIVETGEMKNLTTGDIYFLANDPTFPTSNTLQTPLSQISRTVYSTPASPAVTYEPGALPQSFLQNRVSYAYTDEDGDDGTTDDRVYTYYSYDPHGNVEWLIQDLPGLGQSSMRYEYDLISGKVTKFLYQEGKADQFFHRYEYDHDSRITKVETSRDGCIWERDAEYFYYAHGPLRRTEIGTDKIQGIDRVYTILGWLKGINHPSLDAQKDPGGDESEHARDAFGMVLGYFPGDFSRENAAGTLQSQFNSGPDGAQAHNLNGSPLFNSFITSWTSGNLTETGNTELYGNSYRYDLYARLKIDSNWSYSSGWTFTNNFHSEYNYDPNGNILSLLRKDKAGVVFDDLTYNYAAGTNRLSHVDDAAGSGLSADDIDDQAADNYIYDALGNLIGDDQEDLGFEWNTYGKVREVTDTNTSRVIFRYDVLRDRIRKEELVYSGGMYIIDKSSWYIREVGGRVVAIVSKQHNGSDTITTVTDIPIYGASRVGVVQARINRFGATPLSEGIFTRLLDTKAYELSDHISNVRTTITDLKEPEAGGNYSVSLESYQNYYPFGMLQQDRRWENSDATYRYGFNGKEQDNIVKGEGNSYDYGARIYDPRIGKWLSTDPFQMKYPDMSPYSFSANSPMNFIDLDGRDIELITDDPLLAIVLKALFETKMGMEIFIRFNMPAFVNPDEPHDVFITLYNTGHKDAKDFKRIAEAKPYLKRDYSSSLVTRDLLGNPRFFTKDRAKWPLFSMDYVDLTASFLKGEASAIFVNPRYAGWEYIFDGDQDDIERQSDIEKKHLERFRNLIFVLIHEIYSHIIIDYGNSGKSTEYEHRDFGNDTFDPNSNLAGQNFTKNSPADVARNQINNIDDDVIRNLIWSALNKHRSENPESKNGKKIWIPASPLKEGHWQKKK